MKTKLIAGAAVLVSLGVGANYALPLKKPTVPPQLKNTSQFCVVLDETTKLYRCETSEVICYLSGSMTCWSKPQLNTPPAPAPVVVHPKPVVPAKPVATPGPAASINPKPHQF
jgi:hypothetical protein